jgi:predicted alpha/beta-hydrolase family hydrolase
LVRELGAGVRRIIAAMAKTAFLFAHGAGAPSGSAWMRAWRERLGTLGDATAFDYPYMRAGRKTPDRLPVLVAAHAEALAGVRARAAGPVFLIGKSMGSRVGCHLVVEQGAAAGVAGLICLGYPLVAARGGAGSVRDEVLLALRTPVLFVQGSRDSLCSIPRLEEVRARMQAPNTLHVVEGGNHSLELPAPKTNAAAQKDADRAVLEAIRRFLQSVVE